MYAIHRVGYHNNADLDNIIEAIFATGKLLPLADRLPASETGIQSVDVFAGDHNMVFLRVSNEWPNTSSAFVFDAEDLIARGAGLRKWDLLLSYWAEAKLVVDEFRLIDDFNATERGILQDMMYYVDDRFEEPYMRYYDDLQAHTVVKMLQDRLSQIAEEGTCYGNEATRLLLSDFNFRSGNSEIVWRGPLPISLALSESPVFQR